MSVFIILPLILCTMHSESADIALAISQIMVLMLYPMAYCAFALMECAFGYPFAPSMLIFVILFFAAIELAPVPMSVLIVLPLILCIMHSESADIALAGIVNVLAVIHTLHIVAYLTFALMARSYAFPCAPLVRVQFLVTAYAALAVYHVVIPDIGIHSAAFIHTALPMSFSIVFPIAPVMGKIRFLIVANGAYAACKKMFSTIFNGIAAFSLTRNPMVHIISVIVFTPLMFFMFSGVTADFAFNSTIVIIFQFMFTERRWINGIAAFNSTYYPVPLIIKVPLANNMILMRTFISTHAAYKSIVLRIRNHGMRYVLINRATSFNGAYMPVVYIIFYPITAKIMLFMIYGIATYAALAVYHVVIANISMHIAAFIRTVLPVHFSIIFPIAPVMGKIRFQIFANNTSAACKNMPTALLTGIAAFNLAPNPMIHIISAIMFAPLMCMRALTADFARYIMANLFYFVATFCGTMTFMIGSLAFPCAPFVRVLRHTVTADFAGYIMASRFYFVTTLRGTMTFMIGSLAFPCAPFMRVLRHTVTADFARYIMASRFYFVTTLRGTMVLMVSSFAFPCTPFVHMLFAFCQRTAASGNRLRKQQYSHNYGRQPMFFHGLSPYSWFIG